MFFSCASIGAIYICVVFNIRRPGINVQVEKPTPSPTEQSNRCERAQFPVKLPLSGVLTDVKFSTDFQAKS